MSLLAHERIDLTMGVDMYNKFERPWSALKNSEAALKKFPLSSKISMLQVVN
jgi:hypothetical protein